MTTYTHLDTTPENMTTLGRWADNHERGNSMTFRESRIAVDRAGEEHRPGVASHAEQLPETATVEEMNRYADNYLAESAARVTVVTVIRTRLRLRRAHAALYGDRNRIETMDPVATVKARALELLDRDTDHSRAMFDDLANGFDITGESGADDIDRAVEEYWGKGADRGSVMWLATTLRFEAARDRLAGTNAARPLTKDEREERRKADALEMVSRDDAEADRMWFDLATDHGVAWSSTDEDVEYAVARYWSPGSELNIDSVAWLATGMRFTKVRNELRRSSWDRAAKHESRDTHDDRIKWSDLAFKHGLDIDGDGANLDATVERYLAATYPYAGTAGLVPVTTVRFQRARAMAQAVRAATASIEPKRSDLGGHVQGPGPDLADSIPVFLPNVGEGVVTAIPLDADGNERPGASVIADAFTNIGIAADTLRHEKAKVELPRHFRDKYEAAQLKTRPFVGGLPAPLGTLDGAVVFKHAEPVDLPGGVVRTDIVKTDSVSITFSDPDGKLHAMLTGLHRDECARHDAEGQGEPVKRSLIEDAVDAILIAGVTAYWRARLGARELSRDVASWLKYL